MISESPIQIESEEKIIDYPLVYELSTRHKSQWQKKETQGDNRKKEINCAKIVVLTLRSKWKRGNLGDIEIQYIPDSPTIFVQDYVDAKTGKLEKGLKSLGYDIAGEDYRRAVKEDIKFIDGMLYLENYGGVGNRRLLEFVHYHSSNESAPNFKRTAKMNTMFLFREFVKEKKAVVQLENLEIDNDAHNLFTNLRSKTKSGFDYDTAKLNALLAMFELSGLASNQSSEKMLALKPFVNNSVTFMRRYNDTMAKYRMDVGVAAKLKIATIGEKEATIKIAEILPISFSFTKDKKDDKIEELIFHFIGTEEGKITYLQMVGEIENKKIEALQK